MQRVRGGRQHRLMANDRAIGRFGATAGNWSRQAAPGHEIGDIGDPILGNLGYNRLQDSVIGEQDPCLVRGRRAFEDRAKEDLEFGLWIGCSVGPRHQGMGMHVSPALHHLGEEIVPRVEMPIARSLGGPDALGHALDVHRSRAELEQCLQPRVDPVVPG